MAFDARSQRILNQLRTYLASIVDEHARATVGAWVRAWDDVAPELEAALDELAIAVGDGKVTRSQIIKARRLNNALDLIETRLSGLVDGSARHIVGQLRAVVDHAGYTTDSLIDSQLPQPLPGRAWSKVDARQVEAIVQRTTERITKTSFPLSGEATASIKRNLVRGMIVGTNPREVARRAVRQAEQGFNGGLTRALTIARTEILDAHRSASKLAQQAHTDVLTSWVWVADLGPRTCPACWGLNGTVHPLDESGPDGHQNCRCVRVPKTKSWRDLGFDIDEPPSLLPDAGTAFANLGPRDQIHVLGPSRYTAWKAGKFPMSKWATLRKNPGWRDSWNTAPVPAGFKGKTSKTALQTHNPAQAAKLRKQIAAGALDNASLLKARQELVKAELGDWADGLPVRPAGVTSDAARDLAETNPKYNPGTQYSVNCQRCVSVYELRRRVEVLEISAAPLPPREHATANATFGKWFPGVVGKAKAYKPDRTAPSWVDDTRDWVTKQAQAWPEGARGFVWFYRSHGAGHIFSVERTTSGVQFVDPQVGVVHPDYWGQMREVFVSRVDNVNPDSSVLKAIEQKPQGGQP